jgi:hypothetical protein
LLGGIAVGFWFANNKTHAIYFGAIGALMLVVTFGLQVWQYELPPPAFRVEHIAALFARESGNIVWHEAPEPAIGKIRIAEYLSVTNLQNLATSIESYRLEGLNNNVPWTIKTAPTWADVFWAFDRKQAVPLDLRACGLNFRLLDRSIKPGETVSGWIWITDVRWPQSMRMLLRTNKGDVFSVPVTEPNIDAGDVGIQGGEMKFINKKFDLSSMRYSD